VTAAKKAKLSSSKRTLFEVQFDGTHLRIWRRDGGEVLLTWSQIQAIKDEMAGPDVEMYEVYPRDEDVVDSAPIRHLWLQWGTPRGRWLMYEGND